MLNLLLMTLLVINYSVESESLLGTFPVVQRDARFGIKEGRGGAIGPCYYS